ncbi:MAG TPA: hypothetical protein VFB02_10415 [Bradyrhizobium sp.]|jgi:hypothetical protein|nr:hypothetical protein [Bradyrhizobium sp.]
MRTTIFIAALAAAISSIASAASAADPFPKFDIAKNCKAEVAENSGIGETLESCTRDEQQAMQELMPQWDHYRREDKTVCIRETSLDGSPSYVELQTCLEIADDKPRTKDKQ